MSLTAALLILIAGIVAGAVNVIIGGGSLITFPTLLALGYPPVLANVTNCVGMNPGNVSGVLSYRPELVGQRDRTIRLGSAVLLGGLCGAVLLLALPASVFRAVVPLLIAFAALLMAVQPWLRRWIEQRNDGATAPGAMLWLAMYLSGVYGGYFGAAQGVILMAVMAVFIDDSLQRLNGTQNLLTLLVNGVATILFVCTTSIAWLAAVLIGAGTFGGGFIGGKVGHRIPDRALRWVIVGAGLGIAAYLELHMH